MQRLGRHRYFAFIAQIVALRGTCGKMKVGCVLVANNRIISTGYNSSHPGAAHCDTENLANCMDLNGHCRRVLHAEVSAVLAIEHPKQNITAYVTHEPCSRCYPILAQAGVTKVYYIHPYAPSTAEKDMMHKLEAWIGLEKEMLPEECNLKNSNLIDEYFK
jgi:dCMP deaminase